jgi:hypothetical protein
MQNLAGKVDCDVFILEELYKAGVCIVEHPEPLRREVPASLTGVMGKFTFARAWYYWVVEGPVPLSVAKILYDHPRGREDVRVAGHCGCPPPEKWATNGYVYDYHIDSQSGLNFFCDTLREAGLISWPLADVSDLRKKVQARGRALLDEQYEKRQKERA